MSFILDEQNTKVDDGTWLEYRGCKFLIASNSSLKFMRVMTRLQRPHKRLLEKGNLDAGVQQGIIISAMAEAVVLDWKGVQNKAGEEVPYSIEAAKTALKNDPAFREIVMEFSSDIANFQEEEADHEEKS